jgi:hypothetical protein
VRKIRQGAAGSAAHSGASNMNIFKSEETTAIDKMSEVEGEIRDFVRRDVASFRRPLASDGELVASNIGSLLQRVSGSSVVEIDRLIAELKALRATLHQEGERVSREIVEYAALSQTAMQSTRMLAESLSRWKRVADAPSISA